MKIYCLYSPSHKRLFADYFLPSIPDELSVYSVAQTQQRGNGEYANGPGWLYHAVSKVAWWAEACRDNIGEVFICADVDIQFFGPVKDVILPLMKGNDVLIQVNSQIGECCMGFVACRGSERLASFWEKIKTEVTNRNDPNFDDQDAFNMLRDEIQWDYLPANKFYTVGMTLGQVWQPGMKIKVPRNILMYHANWTVGEQNKTTLLDKVKSIVDKNRGKQKGD